MAARDPDGHAKLSPRGSGRANHLAHTQAHDALSDVQTTIALARLLRARQPRLFDYYFSLRRKQRPSNCSIMCIAHRCCMYRRVIRPNAAAWRWSCRWHYIRLNPNSVIVYDLDADPAALLELDAEDIADRVFTPRGDLPEDIERIPLKTVQANKSPALAPLSVLAGVDTARIGLECRTLPRASGNFAPGRRLDGKSASGLQREARRRRKDRSRTGAVSRRYPAMRTSACATTCASRRQPSLARATFRFAISRYPELLFRYRARNFPASLSPPEATRWDEFRRATIDYPDRNDDADAGRLFSARSRSCARRPM